MFTICFRGIALTFQLLGFFHMIIIFSINTKSFIFVISDISTLPLLIGRQEGIQPVKTEW